MIRAVIAATLAPLCAGDFHGRAVSEGIAVDVSISRAGAPAPASTLRAGDDVSIRFSVVDTATGAPLRGAHPASWVDVPHGGESCNQRISEYVSGSLLSRAELDLNNFYVLALNEDATVTVVDPLFGYGGTKLLAMVPLASPGLDWALTPDESRLFVSMPAANRVAVVDTARWKTASTVEVAGHPSRVAMQPDGHYVWIGYDSGVAVLDAATGTSAARIETGRGAHEIAFTGDSRYAIVANAGDSTVSIVDVWKLKATGTLPLSGPPVSLAYSPLSRAAYVATAADGIVDVIDPEAISRIAQVHATPGEVQIRMAPGGRYAFLANPGKNVVQILDASSNRVVQTAAMPDGPDQVVFSDNLAYVRRRASETVLMIPLANIGGEHEPVPAADLPGGQSPLGKTTAPSLGDTLAEAPGGDGMLVANPTDRTIYYYKEGMAAPMGNFSNYGREPRAVLVVDRSLRERAAGVYETSVRLERAGPHRIAFLLDSPRVMQCFDLPIQPGEGQPDDLHPIRIEPLVASRVVPTGATVRLRFRLTDTITHQPRSGLRDVRLLAFLAPGIWQKRVAADPAGDGLYEADFAPPRAGFYYVYLASPTLGIPFDNPQYLVLQATQ